MVCVARILCSSITKRFVADVVPSTPKRARSDPPLCRQKFHTDDLQADNVLGSCPNVQVLTSRLGAFKGLFSRWASKANIVVIKKDEAIGLYPGVYSYEYPGTPKVRKHRNYLVTVGAFPEYKHEYQGVPGRWVLDASAFAGDHTHGVGHLLNSSHPMLCPPYDKPNCYLEEDDYDPECGILGVVPFIFSTALRAIYRDT
jgi:hypothetical protein